MPGDPMPDRLVEMKRGYDRERREEQDEQPLPERRDSFHREIAGCFSAIAIFQSLSCNLQPAISCSSSAGRLLFHLAGTWALPLVDRDEPRFAEASREMIERSDYVVPYFNDRYRFDKPPLTYWAQVASYRVFGENPFGARLPTAVAAALTALVIFAWGARLRTGARGLVGGDFLHALSPDLSARQSRGRRYVAGVFRRPWRTGPATRFGAIALAEAGAAQSCGREPRAAGGGFSISRSRSVFSPKDRSPGSRWARLASANFCGRRPHFARRFLFVRGMLLSSRAGGALGRARAAPHAWRISRGRARPPCRRALLRDDAGTWRALGAGRAWIAPLLFSHRLRELRAVVGKSCHRSRAGFGKSAMPLDLYLIAGVALIFVIFSIVKTKLPHYILPAFPLLAFLLARHWEADLAHAREMVAHDRCGVPRDRADRIPVASAAFSGRPPFLKRQSLIFSRRWISPLTISTRRVWSGSFAAAFTAFSFITGRKAAMCRRFSRIRCPIFSPAQVRISSSCRRGWRNGFTPRCRAVIGSSQRAGSTSPRARWVDLTLILKNT